MADRASITAIAPWFGGKRNLAPAIVEELGPHRFYVEPFCGSMAVLIAKPEATTEIVCDLHGDLINLARVVQDPQDGPRLYRRLRRCWMSEVEHGEATQRMAMPFQPGVDRAFDYFVFSWQGRNGVSGTTAYNVTFARRFTPNGGQGGKRFQSAVSSIPAWRRRLRNVNILCGDGFKVLEKTDDAAGVAVYIDPPYLEKGAKYVHDFEASDHERLAELAKRFRTARVVVSYYNHPELARLYPGWTKRIIKVSKALAHQGRRGANDTKACEILLLNGPSHMNGQSGKLF